MTGAGGSAGTMRATVMTAHGGPDRLELFHLPIPEPGSGQVRVRVTAASVNNTDIWTREGAYGRADDPAAVAGWLGVPIDTPRVQGADVVGVVDAVGTDVDAHRIGTRVLIDPALYDTDDPDTSAGYGRSAQVVPGRPVELVGVVGSEVDGGFAEYALVRADRCHDVSASPLSDRQLATLPIAFGTAMGMLRRADVKENETLLVTGASGGVGVALVQLGRALGATVIAVSTLDKRDDLSALGADHVVDRLDDGVAEAVASLVPDGVDVVADVVGGPRFATWIDSLRTGGRLVVAGAVAGPVVEVDLRRVYLGQRTVLGSTMHDPDTFAALVELAVEGRLDPPIAAVYPLERLAEAQLALRSSDTIGKIVIDPAIS